MFIIHLTYKTELKKIDALLNEHIEFLNKQYEAGYFLISGRKVPRTGGIIIAKVASKMEIEEILEQDPFKQHDLAEYELIEFVASKTHTALEFLQN